MTKLPKYLRAAVQSVREHEYEEHLEYNLSAIIVIGGQIVSIGHNSSKANSFIRAFSNKEYGGMHAECDAILSARKKIDLTGSKMYVARLTKKLGQVAVAKPCDMCLGAALRYGIKRICYTIDDMSWGTIRL